MGVGKMPRGRWPKTTHLPQLWNRRYVLQRNQAKFRKEEWAYTPDTWYKKWFDSGVMEHHGRKGWQYCMVRKDPLEAWSPNNCVIITRRKHLARCLGIMHRVFDEHFWTDEDDVTKKIK